MSDEGKLWHVSWWRSGGITCFISAHTGSRCAQREGGFTLRSGMCQSRGSFPRLTHILALQYQTNCNGFIWATDILSNLLYYSIGPSCTDRTESVTESFSFHWLFKLSNCWKPKLLDC